MKKSIYIYIIVLMILLTITSINLFDARKQIEAYEDSQDVRISNEDARNQLITQIEELENLNEQRKQEINHLLSKNGDLLNDNANLQSIIMELEITDPGSVFILEGWGIDSLDTIAEDLISKPEIIGIDAVLGGTMAFERVYVLNEKYVYAYFSDGHIIGYGVYRFNIDEDLNITWETIVETLIGSDVED